MPSRLLVSDLQNSRIPVSLNVCPTDERFYQWLSEAEQRMLNQGRWVGSVREIQMCKDPCDGCITWPRQVDAVEQVAVNGQPIASFNGWYSYTRLLTNLKQCRGCGCSSSGGNPATDGTFGAGGGCGCQYVENRMKEGDVASFATTRGENKVIRTYPTDTNDVGKKIIYQGNDSNGIWVRTEIDGVMSDGEQVTLALPFVDTTTVWGPGAPMAAIKEVTQRRVLVYSYDTVEAVERALADYEPGETRPAYRTSFIPNLRAARVGGCTTDGTETTTITALVSLQHVPFTSPGDWLILQNLPAYKAAMMAVKFYEEGDVARGDWYFYGTQAQSRNGRGVMRVVNRGGAIPLLQAELRKNSSDRVSAFVYLEETNRQVRDMAGFR